MFEILFSKFDIEPSKILVKADEVIHLKVTLRSLVEDNFVDDDTPPISFNYGEGGQEYASI